MLFNAIVIGGGFYGATIATYLAKQRGFTKVALIECEPQLLMRASFNNQARVHNGYHYPRSFTTAFRSRVNLPRFIHDYPEAVKTDFTKLYAIARKNSKVNAKQFERFCHSIGAKFERAPQSLRGLFEPRLIEQVYITEEFAFDARLLASRAQQELDEVGVTILFNTKAESIYSQGEIYSINCSNATDNFELQAYYVFNCTYSGLNQLNGELPSSKVRLKHEITEMLLLRPPALLQNIGVTVMDGPFFSMIPFPALDLHTLSHVRYTPHLHWYDELSINPYSRLREYSKDSHANWMLRDTARFLPSILNAKLIDSIFEVKTILIKNEGDDGRPILFDHHATMPGCYSILGSKIDNIYDVIEKLDSEPLTAHQI